MSLFGLIEKRSTFASPDRFLLDWFGGRATESGLTVSEQNALTYSTVWACVHVIAEAIGKLPLQLYRHKDNGDHELVADLPVARLLAAEPNDEMSTVSFKSLLMGWTLTWGNGYAEIERNNAGLPIALHPLAPNRIVPRRRSSDPVTGFKDWRIEYFVTRTAMQSPYLLEQPVLTENPIDRDDMLHMAGLGFDGIIGYSPVAMTREAMGLGLATQAYGARFFGNSGVPSGVLESERTVKDPAKLRAQWKAANGGGEQRGTAVLEDGVKFKPIGIPPEDGQFLETRKFQRTEICGIYRVPPHKIGDLERSTNNNIEHQEMDFVSNSLMGWLVRMEQECTRKLLTPQQKAAGYFFAFDVDDVLRGDQLARYQAYAVARQWGWMSADDVLHREKRNALPGGQGAIYLVPMNMVPADRVMAAADPGGQGDQVTAGEPAKADPPALPAAGDPKQLPAAAPGRSAKLRANFRALLVEAAARAVHKETAAVRRAARKPEAFAAAVREFYDGHGDHLRGVLITPASSLGDLLEIPFATTRAAVAHVADELVGRAMTELSDPKTLDVETIAAGWDQERAAQIADGVLAAMGV